MVDLKGMSHLELLKLLIVKEKCGTDKVDLFIRSSMYRLYTNVSTWCVSLHYEFHANVPRVRVSALIIASHPTPRHPKDVDTSRILTNLAAALLKRHKDAEASP